MKCRQMIRRVSIQGNIKFKRKREEGIRRGESSDHSGNEKVNEKKTGRRRKHEEWKERREERVEWESLLCLVM